MPFCITPNSRIKNRGKSGTGEMDLPPFDLSGFERDLPRIYLNSSTREELINNFQLFYDTYFYPATLISMILFDENKQPAEVISARTFAGLSRTADDWALSNPASIANYALFQTSPGIINNFIDTSGERVNGFFQIPADFFPTDSTGDMDLGSRLKNCTIKYSDIPSITDYRLLRAESAEKTENYLCSAILAPLWNNNRLLGAILIGTDLYHLYTAQNAAILGPEHLIFLQRALQQITLALAGITSQMRAM